MALESILSKLPETAATKKSIAVDITEEEKLFPDPENIVGPALVEDGDFLLTSATAIARYLAKTIASVSHCSNCLKGQCQVRSSH